MAIWSLILSGVGNFFGKVWDISRQLVSWMFNVMPKPLRFFFFLYMVLFLASVAVPKFLGTGYSCDSMGNAYKINIVTLYATEQEINTLASVCGVEGTPLANAG